MCDRDRRVPNDIRYPNAAGIEWRELSARDRRFLKRTIDLAKKREVDFQNHSAVLVRGSKIIAIGYNSYKNEPSVLSTEHVRMVKGRNTVMGVGPHAEVDALSNVKDASGMTLYVSRVLRNGSVGNSAPCEGCQTTARALGVRRIVWTEGGEIF